MHEHYWCLLRWSHQAPCCILVAEARPLALIEAGCRRRAWSGHTDVGCNTFSEVRHEDSHRHRLKSLTRRLISDFLPLYSIANACLQMLLHLILLG